MSESEKLDTDYVWYTDLKKSKNELAKISPSFCLAKWLQVTLHLHKGTTHSCHHPPTHQIQIDDIKDNPSGLHNTNKTNANSCLMVSSRHHVNTVGISKMQTLKPLAIE